MIPSIRSRIDEGNTVTEDGDGAPDHRSAGIPVSELAELIELRRMEYIRRSREKNDARLAEVDALANAVQEMPVDGNRPFGLPEGMAPYDIWDMILGHIQNPEDIIRVSDTCDLFRDLLKPKYIALRMVEVAPIISDKLNVLTLRRVCRSTKIAVDELLRKDFLDYKWLDTDADWEIEAKIIRPPLLVNTTTNPPLDLFGRFLNIASSPAIESVSNDCFPFRKIYYSDHEEDIGGPRLPELRTQFKRILGFVGIGSSIRNLNFCCAAENNQGCYDLLRSVVALMPNLVDLKVSIGSHLFPRDAHELQLQPFPKCPNLKRYTFDGRGGVAPAIVAEIILANPTISHFNHWYDPPFRNWHAFKREEFGSILDILNGSEAVISTYKVHAYWELPPLNFLESGLRWPLRKLSFAEHLGERFEAVSSKALFRFINSFSMTLEEVTITWKLKDTGGYLDLPKVTKMLWKPWPAFMDIEVIVALENLQDLDLDLTACNQANGSIENAKIFVDEMNLPPLFPAMRKIRARARTQDVPDEQGFGAWPEWQIVWTGWADHEIW